MKRGALLGAAAFVAIGFGAVFATRATGPTAVVASGVVHDRVVADARVVAIDGTAAITAAEGGRAVRVLVREGDHVDVGQLLAQLGPTTDAGTDGKLVRVTSPVAGSVLARHVDVGDTVSPQTPTPLFEVADPTRTELRVEIDEPVAQRIKEGEAARVVGPGGKPTLAAAVVRRVSDRIEARTVAAEEGRGLHEGWVRVAWATWQGPSPNLPLGAHVEVVVQRGERSAAALVPRCAASVREGHGVVEESFLLWTREVRVELGAADDGFVEVTGVPLGTVVRCP